MKCTGPAHCYVGVGPGFTPLYMGTAERSPSIEIVRNYEPISNDIGGAEPVDDSYQGRSARIEYDFNLWNEAVFALLEKTNPFSPTERGTEDDGDVGSLMQLEGKSYPLWVQFPYSSKPSMDLPAGYRFLSCICVTDLHSVLGTANKRVRVAWVARRVRKKAGGGAAVNQSVLAAGASLAAGGGGFKGGGGNILSLLPGNTPAKGWTLYDHNMVGLPDV